MNRRKLHALLIAALISTTAGAAQAADGTWHLDADGNWSDNANWIPASPNAIDASALLGNALTADRTITLDTPVTLGELTFASPFRYTLAGSNPNALTFQVSTGNAAILIDAASASATHTVTAPITLASPLHITNASSGTLLLSGPLSGNGPLTLHSGRLQLTADNAAWNGDITLNGGFLDTSSASITSLGNPTAGAITVNPGATLNVNGLATSVTGYPVFTKTVTLAGNGSAANPQALRYSRGYHGTLDGHTILNGGATFFIQNNTNTLLNIGNPAGTTTATLSGTGPLTKEGTGTLQINVPSTHTGGTLINAGTVTLGTNGSLVGTGLTTVNPGGHFRVSKPAGNDPASASASPQSVRLQGGTLSLNADLQIAPFLAPNTTDGIISITSYNGSFSTQFTNGGTNLIDFNALPGGANLRLASSGTVKIPAAVAIVPHQSHQTFRFGTPGAAGTFTIDSVLADDGPTPRHVDVQGGRVKLTGNNSYSGQTIIHSGTLEIEHHNALGTSSGTDADGTIVKPGATLLVGYITAPLNERIALQSATLLGSFEDLTGEIHIEGTSSIKATIANGPITGPGSLTVDGVTFNTANTYTGPTLITAGTNKVNAANAFAGTSRVTVTGGSLTLSAPSGLTGPMILQGGTTTVNHPDALGSPGVSALVLGGAVLSIGSINKPILVSGGEVKVSSPTPISADNITLRGGALTGGTIYDTTITSNVAVDGSRIPATLRGETNQIKWLALQGGLQGKGDVRLAYKVKIDGPLSIDGNVVVGSQAWSASYTSGTALADVVFNAPSAIHGRLDVQAGNATYNVNGSVDHIRMKGGSLFAAPGVTLNVTELELRSGTLAANIQGPEDLTKTSYGSLGADLGASFDGAIEIAGGIYIASGTHGMGSTVGATTITSRDHAHLFIAWGSSTAENINLNNARGFAYSGALSGDSSYITGTVDLGSQAGYIGSTNSSARTLTLSGPITGGSLVKAGNSVLRIRGNANTYTGDTIVRSGELRLYIDGRLTTTSGVDLHRGGMLALDNDYTLVSDRLADTVPVRLHGGTLELVRDSQVTTEAVGSVLLARGTSTIKTSQPNYATGTNLILQNLARQTGATVTFSGDGLGQIDEAGNIFINATPALNDGIIGGWAIAGGGFATYDQWGVRNLSAYQNDIHSAGAADNVWQSGPTTLAAPRTINSLVMQGAGTLDLAGHTLTVDTGGIYMRDNGSFSNGHIAVGPGSQELLLYTELSSVSTISSALIEQGGTPISLVKFGPGHLTLSGTSTYSGATYINDGTLNLVNASAIPAASPVVINGGTLMVQSTVASLQLHSIALRDDGFLLGTDATSLTTSVFSLESGTVEIPLAGNFPLIKTTEGVGILRRNNPNYAGPILIDDGILIVQEMAYNVGLGTGVTTINPNGRLVLQSPSYYASLTADIILAGGQLSGTFTSQGTPVLRGSLHVAAPSAIRLFDLSVSSASSASIEIAASISGNADLTVDGLGTLILSGDNAAYTGNIFLQGGEIQFKHPDAIAGATLYATDDGLITLGSPLNGGQIVMQGGQLRSWSTQSLETPIGANLHITANTTLQSQSGKMFLNGSTSLAPGATLSIAGIQQVHFNGPTSLQGRVNVLSGATTFNVDANSGDGPRPHLSASSTAALHFTVSQNLASLSLYDLATATLTPGGNKQITTAQLAIEPTAALNLTDNALLITNGNHADILALLLAGRTDAVGIYSSLAAADPAHYVLGISNPASPDVLVKFTFAADANLDGIVNVGDLGLLASNWSATNTGFWNGDLNFDGIVNVGDLGLLASNWNAGAPNNLPLHEALALFPQLAGLAVPEPSTLSLTAAATTLLLTPRRRKPAP